MNRPPDFIIGDADDPYLLRWWILPRNKVFNVYLHKMVRDDDDRALHDHPWLNVSIVLRGGYWEVMPSKMKWRRPGSIIFRRTTAAHRLMLAEPCGPSWSLFITGPRIRQWGFHCPNGWVPWTAFVTKTDNSSTGKGCAE